MGPLEARRSGEMEREWMESATLPAQQRFLFTRHLALLFGSGVPLVRSLEALAEQADHPTTAEVLWCLQRDLERGQPLSRACARFPEIFGPTYVAVLQVAEQSGALHRSLMQLAEWLEQEAASRRSLAALLAYPLFILGLTLLMSLWMCWAVLPPILAGLEGVALPWPTRLLMLATALLQKPLGLALVAGLSLGGLGLSYRTWLRPPVGLRFWFWQQVVRVPVLGVALRDWALLRYCAAAEILLESGSSLVTSLTLAPRAAGNPWLADDSSRLCTALEHGQELAAVLQTRPLLYGRLLPALVLAYSESGLLSRGFARARRGLEQEVESRFAVLRQALEPLLLAVLGGLVLFFLLSVMLPLYAQLQQL